MNDKARLYMGALDHLMRHALTGCGRSGSHAERLLTVISGDQELDGDTRRLCECLADLLREGQQVDLARPTP